MRKKFFILATVLLLGPGAETRPATASPYSAHGGGVGSTGTLIIEVRPYIGGGGPPDGYAIFISPRWFSSAIAFDCVEVTASLLGGRLEASGVDSFGIRRYLTVVDSGPGALADFYTISSLANAGSYCGAPGTADDVLPGGGFVISSLYFV